MFRKLIIRLVLMTIGINSVAVLALGVMGYLALQEPAYYAKLRGQNFLETDASALETNLKLIERDLAFWTQTSLERQRRQSSALPAELQQADEAYDPRADVKSITLTQDQLNTMLASSSATKQGDWRNPRIRLEKDRLNFAFEFAAQQFHLVLSVELQPSLEQDGRWRFDLLSARVGRLRLPIQTVLQWLPLEPSYRDKNMELILTGTTPHVLVAPPVLGKDSPTVQSIQVVKGKLIVELLPPILPPQQLAAADEPVDWAILD